MSIHSRWLPGCAILALLVTGTSVQALPPQFIKLAMLQSTNDPPTTEEGDAKENDDAAQEEGTRTQEQSESTSDHPDPRKALNERFKEATSPLDKAKAALALSRRILVDEAQGPLSLELADIDSKREDLAKLVHEGLQYLKDADTAIKEMPRGDSERTKLEDHVEMLRAFATVFLALTEEKESTQSDALLEKCADLAVYLDDPRHGVVDAARLWLGVAYRRAGRPDRAIQVLRLGIAKPKDLRFGFWSRIQCCLALADRGQCVAATAVALRLKSRLDSWFDGEDEKTRERARAGVRLAFRGISRQWRKQVKDSAATSAPASMPVELFTSQSAELKEDDVLALMETIPGLPKWDDKGEGGSATSKKSEEPADESGDEPNSEKVPSESP